MSCLEISKYFWKLNGLLVFGKHLSAAFCSIKAPDSRIKQLLITIRDIQEVGSSDLTSSQKPIFLCFTLNSFRGHCGDGGFMGTSVS